mgnify:CR=1 FL=1
MTGIMIIYMMMSLIFYIAVIALLVTSQRYLIYKKSRFEKLFALVTFIVSIIVFAAFYNSSFWTPRSDGCINHVSVYSDEPFESRQIGVQQVVAGGYQQKKVIAVGKFIAGNDGNVRYYDVSVKNGKFTVEGAKTEYAECIGRSLKAQYKGIRSFTGRTISYDELNRAAEKSIYYYDDERSVGSLLITGAVIFLPVTIVALDYIIMLRKRRKKNLLMKTRLEDIG